MKAFVFLLLGLAVAAPAAVAGEDHDRVRRAVESGEILPLRTILERAESAVPGQLLEAELESGHHRLTYELKVLTPDNRVIKLLYDARTGELLRTHGKDDRP